MNDTARIPTPNSSWRRALDRRRGRASRASGRATGVLPAAAVATTAAFAGGGLLTQTVLVPSWRAMDPAAFLPHFAKYGPATGATLFPLELTSTVLLGRVASLASKQRRPGRRAWVLATGCMVGTLALLPVYFAGTNRALLDPDFPVEDVPGELRTWYAWNWLRTGLALLATVLSGAAHGSGES